MPTWLEWVLTIWILPQVIIPIVGTIASYCGAFDPKPKQVPTPIITLRPPRPSLPMPKHSSFPPPAYG